MSAATQHDPDLPVVLGPERTALRVRLDRSELADSLASVVLRVPENGGALRTIAGGLFGHATGVFSSRKNGLLQPYDGLHERALVHLGEADARRPFYQTQACAIAWVGASGWNEWIVDHLVQRLDGGIEAVEVKRSPRDLRKPGYPLKLATGFALAKSFGFEPRLQYADEIHGGVHRRRNLALIVRRRTANVPDEATARVDEMAHDSTVQPVGRLRRALANDEVVGMARVHSLAAQGRLAFDLDARLCDATPATILPARRPACRIRF